MGQRIDLDYDDLEWFALEMDWDHSVIFEIASKYCILDSTVIINIHYYLLFLFWKYMCKC